MAIPATQMRPGMIIKHNEQLHLVFKVEHRTPGNLRAFIQDKDGEISELKATPKEDDSAAKPAPKPDAGK